MSDIVDMGVTPEQSKESSPGLVSKSDSKEPSYPTVTFRDQHKDKLLEALGTKKLALNDKIVVVMELELCGASDQNYNKSLEFKITGLGPEEDDNEEETSEGEDTMVMVKAEKGTHKNPTVRRLKADNTDSKKSY